jgi:hypothetical protein
MTPGRQATGWPDNDGLRRSIHHPRRFLEVYVEVYCIPHTVVLK